MEFETICFHQKCSCRAFSCSPKTVITYLPLAARILFAFMRQLHGKASIYGTAVCYKIFTNLKYTLFKVTKNNEVQPQLAFPYSPSNADKRCTFLPRRISTGNSGEINTPLKIAWGSKIRRVSNKLLCSNFRRGQYLLLKLLVFDTNSIWILASARDDLSTKCNFLKGNLQCNALLWRVQLDWIWFDSNVGKFAILIRTANSRRDQTANNAKGGKCACVSTLLQSLLALNVTFLFCLKLAALMRG